MSTTSAERMRVLREKLRNEGFVSRLVWVRPENMEKLKKVEKKLRKT